MTTGLAAIEMVHNCDCGLCQACIARVQPQDSFHAMVPVPSAALTAEDVTGLPVNRTFVVHVDDGSNLFDSSAIAIALGALPGSRGSAGRVATQKVALASFQAGGDVADYAVANHRQQNFAVLVRCGALGSDRQVPAP